MGNIVWRGIVYGILMAAGKLITGLWLVRFSGNPLSTLISSIASLFSCQSRGSSQETEKTSGKRRQYQIPAEGHQTRSKTASAGDQSQSTGTSASDISNQSNSRSLSQNRTNSLPPKPKSLYPPAILGLAMVARGEIGYLIASLAESQGIFGGTFGASEIYLVVIWAISICTLVGPIAVGSLVKRVNKLQRLRDNEGGLDPLGAWRI